MLVLVLAAIACYAMSLAPATWVVISEIFPNRIRSSGVSVAVTALSVSYTHLDVYKRQIRDSVGADCELADRAPCRSRQFGARNIAFVEWTMGMALDVCGDCRSFGSVLGGIAAGA